MAGQTSATKFKKGESGNPNGRPPKGYSITETIRAMMDEKPAIKQELAQKILQKALQGDRDAIKLLWNYLEGMPMQKTDLTSNGESLKINFHDALKTNGNTDNIHATPKPDSNSQEQSEE